MSESDWIIAETAFDADRMHHRETVFTLGNGYLGTRGSFPEGYPGERPATLIHGVYDDVPIVYTELANCPNWLPLNVFVEDERFRLDRGKVLRYERRLDLRRGVLCRDIRWQSTSDHTVDLRFERFASLDDPHVLAMRCQVTPVNQACRISVQADINGYPDNMGVLHWDWVEQGNQDDTTWLHARTRHTAIDLAMAARLAVTGAGDAPVRAMRCHNCPALTTEFYAQQGQKATLTKLVTVFTSRDVDNPRQAAQDRLEHLADYCELLVAHEAAWTRAWEASDVVIEGDALAQRAVRYSLFQILNAVPRHDDRVSVSAKTLSGFGYRGHVFWDTEIFLLPFLTYTQPALARNLLTYRYHTLPGARRKAQREGYEGAMYAWESADTGDEVTPRYVPGPHGEGLVRIWCGDIELHIISDVAYAVWRYWQATGDDEWMRNHGAEIVLSTAVFWGSRVEWNAMQNRYEITDVIGPDENHEHVDNNAFTNRLVQWHLETAIDVLDWLHESDAERARALTAELDLTPERLAHWQDVCKRIHVPHDPQTGLIEQAEGFFRLQDLDLTEYEPRQKSMQAILGIEQTNRCQVLKQPDALMLLYLLRDHYDQQAFQSNWDYYAPRTDHTYGSSLGPALHATVASMLNKPQEAYQHFMRAVLVDLEDLRGNTLEGVHAASAGGVWQALVFGFAGVRLTEAGPTANSRLPPGWTRLTFRLQHRGQCYDLDITPDSEHVVRDTQCGKLHTSQTTTSLDGDSAPEHADGEHSLDLDIGGVIFDLDGVLTDTSEYHYLAWKRVADEKGIPFDREANEALRGVPRRESLMRLLDGRPATEEQIQEMMTRKNSYYQESISRVTRDNLLPGALELLQEIKAAGIKIAIGSASKNARAVISRLGISEWIDAISDGRSVERHKPAPDLFLHAAQQLGVAPSQCIVVEDAESGVAAALAGGMWAIGLGPGARVGAAHVVLPSLERVCWAEILDYLAQAKPRADR
jgi:beta-phosphoglucomutase